MSKQLILKHPEVKSFLHSEGLKITACSDRDYYCPSWRTLKKAEKYIMKAMWREKLIRHEDKSDCDDWGLAYMHHARRWFAQEFSRIKAQTMAVGYWKVWFRGSSSPHILNVVILNDHGMPTLWVVEPQTFQQRDFHMNDLKEHWAVWI